MNQPMSAVPGGTDSPGPESPHEVMSHRERMRLRAAALHATRAFPGPIGELVARELEAWEEFGFRLGSHATIRQVVEAVLETEIDGSGAA